MNLYTVTVHYTDWREGPTRSTVKLGASNIRVATNKALAEFLGSLTRRNRRDALRHVQVEATRVRNTPAA